jgi:hypothetical protein
MIVRQAEAVANEHFDEVTWKPVCRLLREEAEADAT